MIRSKLKSGTFLAIAAFWLSGAAYAHDYGSALTDRTVHSGASCQHAYQGETLLEQRVEYSHAGGIANKSTDYILSVVCPIANFPAEITKSIWVTVLFDKKPGAKAKQESQCSLVERSGGKFVQSAVHADSDYGQDTLLVELGSVQPYATVALECRIPTHGSRIIAYGVNASYFPR